MKKNIKMLAIIFSVVLNIVFSASYFYRQADRRYFRAHQTGHHRPLYEELDLTRTQRNRFASARDSFHAFILAQGRKIKGKQLELIDLLDNPDPDRRAIDTRQKEIQALQQQMQDKVIAHLLEESGMLRPEQRQKFFALIKERIEKSRSRRPRWMPQTRANHAKGAQR